MCVAYEMRCQCGRKSASFHFKDNVMSEQVIKSLYCPECSTDMNIDAAKMVVDNGWIIEYDMDIVKFQGQKLSVSPMTPDFLFDAGYCTWNGFYPGDHIESVKEREKITSLAKSNPALYLKEIKSWAHERIGRLQDEGWRKAKNGAND